MDFTNIENPENYTGQFVAFVATPTSIKVLASADCIRDLVNKPEVQGFEYAIHKF